MACCRAGSKASVTTQKAHVEPVKLTKGSELRVLSFNAFCRPPGIKNKANDWKSERLTYLAKHEMVNYDLVAFQELFGSFSGRRDHFLRNCALAGHGYHVTSPKPSWKYLIDGGLAIVSKYPIVHTEWKPFAPGCHSDRLAEKGVLYAKVQVSAESNNYVHVFNAHTQSSYNDPVGTLSWKIREKQTLLMLEFIQTITCDDTYPLLIMGDLNINARKEFPQKISSDEYTAFFQQLQGMKSSRGPFDPQPLGYTVTDVLYHYHNNTHPVTFGDAKIEDNNAVTPLETVFTKSHDYGTFQSLDYIFFLSRPDNTTASTSKSAAGPEQHTNTGITPKSAKVAKMFVEGHPFTQLSDHYGAEATFTVN